MSWHVYKFFRVVALCALFCLHSILIGIISAGMLAFKAGALQFSMDIVAMFIVFCFSIFIYVRRNAASSRMLDLIVFSMLFVLSFIGAVGLTARGASRNGKGLCGDFIDTRPERCTEAMVAVAFTWVAVLFAGGGLAVSWLDRNSRMGSCSPSGQQGAVKRLELSNKYPQSSLSSRSHVSQPSESYIPRPRHPYDTPRRPKYSTRSQPHQKDPQRVPSNMTPASPLPPLSSFDPLALGELPPPTQRPLKDLQTREKERVKHLSPMTVFSW